MTSSLTLPSKSIRSGRQSPLPKYQNMTPWLIGKNKNNYRTLYYDVKAEEMSPGVARAKERAGEARGGGLISVPIPGIVERKQLKNFQLLFKPRKLNEF